MINTNANVKNLLEFNDTTKVFRIGGLIFGKPLTAVDHVNLTIPADRPVILSIVGESGCGKTTLSKMALRLLDSSSGSIKLLGNDYNDRKAFPDLDFKLLMQPIFQNPFEAFSMRKTVDTYLFNTALRLKVCSTMEEATKRVEESLQAVGLSLKVVRGKYSSQFSGGELQRVSIARALIPRPKLIIADEPVAMIDASMKMNIVNLFKQLKDDFGVSFIYITHDLSTAYYVSDYIATLYRGCLIEYGPSHLIMEQPAHPYTQLLMDSVPRVGERWEQDVALPDAESKEYALTCCKFSPRCKYATPECLAGRPPYIDIEGGRKVLCIHPLTASGGSTTKA